VSREHTVVIEWWHVTRGTVTTTETVYHARNPQAAIAKAARNSPMPHGWEPEHAYTTEPEPETDE